MQRQTWTLKTASQNAPKRHFREEKKTKNWGRGCPGVEMVPPTTVLHQTSVVAPEFHRLFNPTIIMHYARVYRWRRSVDRQDCQGKKFGCISLSTEKRELRVS